MVSITFADISSMRFFLKFVLAFACRAVKIKKKFLYVHLFAKKPNAL